VKVYNISWNSKNKGTTIKKQEEDELVQGEKKHLDHFIFKFHIFLTSCLLWTVLKTMEAPFEALQNFFKCKDNKVTSKDLKFQNANWSYLQTHMPMTPFILEMAYLVHFFIDLSDFCYIKCTR
jgi:hypothetical protein